MRHVAIFCLLFPMLACKSTNTSEVKDVDAAGTDDRKYSIVCPIPQSDQCKHSRQDWEHEGMCVREARVSANGNDHSATIFLSQDKSVGLEVLRPDREIKLKEQVEKVSGGKLAWVIASDELDFSRGASRPITGDTWIQINVDRSSSERKIIGSLAIDEDFGFLDFACHEAGGSGSIPDGIAPASPVISNSRFPSGEVSWACNNGNSTVLFFKSDTSGGAVAISDVSSTDPNESSPGGDDGLPGNVRPTTQHEACQALDESSGFGISCKSPTLSLKVVGSKQPIVDTSFDATVSRNNIQRNLSCIGRASPVVSNRLANKSYCRKVGSISGGQVETCLHFKENGAGEETDVSGGIPQNDKFSYSITGNKLTVVISDSPLVSRVREFTLASDGSTLSMQEGSNLFVWERK